MAGGKDDAADGLTLPDQIGGGGRGEDAAGGDDHLAEAMGSAHAQDHVNGTTVAISAVSTQHQGFPLHTTQGAEHGFHEAFEIVGRFELLAALAQSGCPGLLIGERSVQLYPTLRRFHRGRGGHHEEWDYAERKHGMTVAACWIRPVAVASHSLRVSSSDMHRPLLLMLLGAGLQLLPADASQAWKRAQPFPEASAAAMNAAEAVIHESGSEECLRGKLSNAILQLSNSCDVSGLSSSVCDLASDIAGRERELDMAEMLTTSETLLQLLSDGASAR